MLLSPDGLPDTLGTRHTGCATAVSSLHHKRTQRTVIFTLLNYEDTEAQREGTVKPNSTAVDDRARPEPGLLPPQSPPGSYSPIISQNLGPRIAASGQTCLLCMQALGSYSQMCLISFLLPVRALGRCMWGPQTWEFVLGKTGSVVWMRSESPQRWQ